MSINTKESYIEIGTSVNDDNTLENVLRLPAPNELPSGNEFIVDGGRNAVGVMFIEQVGRTQYTTGIKWESLPSRKWWEINRWFESYGYVFYMKYFSHTEGRVKIHRFYRGNVEKGEPAGPVEIVGGYAIPSRYKGCGFNVIDMGEDDVSLIYEVSI